MIAFVNGARFERRDLTVLTAQAGRFDDEERGARLACSMFDEGVDVLLHTADLTGRGAIRTAERRERTVIGFMNQDDRRQKERGRDNLDGCRSGGGVPYSKPRS